MFYCAPTGTVRQGEIYDGVPVAGSVPLPLTTFGKPAPQKGGLWTAQVFGGASPHALPTAVAKGAGRGDALVPVQLQRAVLLSRGCDIDNAKVLQFAAIKPLTAAGSDLMQVAIVDGRAKSCHYLPADAPLGFTDSFVDFRQITTVKSDALPTFTRVAGMTRDGVGLLYLALLRHLTAAEVRLEGECANCGATVPLLSQLKETLDPPDDF